METGFGSSTISKTQKYLEKMGIGKEKKAPRWNGENRMDDHYAENVWVPLREAIQMVLVKKDCILADDDDDDATTLDDSFDNMYKTAYTMVNDNYGKSLYVGVKEVITDHLEEEVLPAVLEGLNNNFLQTVNSAWEDHKASLEMIRDILLYLDRCMGMSAVIDFHNYFSSGPMCTRTASRASTIWALSCSDRL